MSKPESTPWKVCKRMEAFSEIQYDSDGTACDERDVHHEMRWIDDVYGNCVISDEYGISKEVLELIVKCVNMHDELVDALMVCIEALKDTPAHGPKSGMLYEEYKSIKALLAKAKGDE